MVHEYLETNGGAPELLVALAIGGYGLVQETKGEGRAGKSGLRKGKGGLQEGQGGSKVFSNFFFFSFSVSVSFSLPARKMSSGLLPF